jgi:hypothetical protein
VLWHDELYTLLASRLDAARLWQAHQDGLDYGPPLNTLATRLVHLFADPGPIASRLPPMLGVLSAAIVVFFIVRRRANASSALSATLLVCFTGALRYAYEARGYGLTIGAFALALLAWTEAAQGRARTVWLPVMAVSVAGAVWSHYYAGLVLVPIGVGELVRAAVRRRIDLPMYVALAASLLLVAPLGGLMLSAASASTTFWARISPPDLWSTYAFVLDRLVGSRFIVVGVLVAIAVIGSAIWDRSGRRTAAWPAHEMAAGAAALLVPALAFWAGLTLTGGAFVPRYALCAAGAVAVVLPLLVWRLGGRRGFVELVLLVLLVTRFGRLAWQTFEPGRLVFVDPVAVRPLLVSSLESHDPLVVTGDAQFLELWYYAEPGARARMRYLVDAEAELQQTGTDSVDANYRVLGRYAPVPFSEVAPFLREHRTFHLYATGSSWILDRLRMRGATLEEEGRESGDPGGVLYRVTLPEPPGG